MEREGPALEALMRRLADTPPDFQAEPWIGGKGEVHVDAVVHDLLRRLGYTVDVADLVEFTAARAAEDRNRLALVLLLAWLLADESISTEGVPQDAVLELLRQESRALAERIPAGKFTADPDRREELARLALARLGLRPAGETPAQAQDRLSTISSVERARVLKAARVAEERARKIREELARKAAEESADKWGRE
ncbi:MAG: hypothetical protein IT349_13120 [Candidatus Eisenbacteria bacterium]|nr:hypothetical protein [Candidatus Eisenbacteria bacterium]